MNRTKKTLTILFFLLGILMVVRLCLPSIAKYVINQTLQNDIDGYTGSVADVDIHLIRSAYSVDSLVLKKVEGKVPVPFIEVPKTDFSIEWKSILKGSLVGEVTVFGPKINFVDGPTEAQSQTGEEGNWKETVKEVFPLRINTFTLNNGEIHFQNFHSSPKVDIFIDQLHLVARNLTNSDKVSKSLISDIDAKAKILGSGDMKIFMKTNALEEEPPFDFKITVENANLVKLNDFFKAYVDVDMEKGKFSMYSEFKGDNGKFKGYVKPIFTDIKILKVEKDVKKGPFRFLKEVGIGLLSSIFKNRRLDRQATKIPISGDINNPDIDVWTTIINAVKNAFIKAIDPGLEGSVDVGKLKDDKEKLKEKEKEERKKERKQKREERKKERQEKREARKKEKEKKDS